MKNAKVKPLKLYRPKTGEDYVGTMELTDETYKGEKYVSLKDYDKLKKDREELLDEAKNYADAIEKLFALISDNTLITADIFDDAITIYNNAEIKTRLM